MTLADTMKSYEREYRRKVPDDSYLLMRLDGKAFHSYTKGLARPYDAGFMADMDATLQYLVANLTGVRMGYVQSDEISLLFTTFSESHREVAVPKRTEFWMGGVEGKMLSIAASMASTYFGQLRYKRHIEEMLLTGSSSIVNPLEAGIIPVFDARLWTFPGTMKGRELTEMYFVHRRRDCIKNSITMAALAEFSHGELEGLSGHARKDKLEAIGKPWESLPEGFRTGRYAVRKTRQEVVTYKRKDGPVGSSEVTRSYWDVEPVADSLHFFTPDRLPLPPKVADNG